MTHAPPVDVSLCLSGRDLSEPIPSPDGAWVVFGVRAAGRSGLVLVPFSGGPERALALDPAPALGRGMGGGAFDWLPDSRGVVYAAQDGQVWMHLLDGSRRQLTALEPGHEVSGPSVSPDGAHVVYVVDLAQVRVVRIGQSGDTGVVGAGVVGAGDVDDWVIGAQHAFVMDPVWSPDGGSIVWQAWDPPAMPWDHSVFVRCDLDSGAETPVQQVLPAGQVQQPRYGSDGRLWGVSDAGGWLNVCCEGRAVLAEEHEHAGPSWGPGQRSFAVSPDGRYVALNRNEGGFGRLVVVDTVSGGVHEVAKAVHGQIRWGGSGITALRSGGRTPTQVVVYEREGNDGPWARRSLAVGPVAEWDHLVEFLVEPEQLVVNTYQGVRVPARAYRPADPALRNPGRMICWVHGGPTDQWQVTFMPRIAFWVSRGWTVLVPDHRGSTGHGRDFQQSLRAQWGVADAQDVAACVAHAHALGWATPDRTVLMGGSAGGYTALNVLMSYPQLAAAAAVVYPVSDPVALAGATHRFESHYNDTLLGPSPVVIDADRLSRPVLIVHGDADPVVPVEHSVALAQRLADRGGEVELHVLAGEGHGFRQPAHQAAEYALMETFVSRVMRLAGS